MQHYKNLQLQDIKYIDDDGRQKLEIWRDIPTYEGFYQASDLGRIKSLSRFVDNGNSGHIISDRIIKQSNADYNSLSCTLCKDNVQIKFKVHTLVAMAFLNHKPCKMLRVVDHIKQNRKDNRLIMLRVITQRENASQSHLKSSSKYVGVYYRKNRNYWDATIRIQDKKHHLGSFKTEIEASNAYNEALKNWSENSIKPKSTVTSSIYKNVSYSKERNRWIAQITINGKRTYVGTFETEIEAGNAQIEAELKQKKHS